MAVLFACFILVSLDYLAIKREIAEMAASQTHIVATFCEAPLAFDDPDTGDEALRALHSIPEAVAGSLYKTDGTLFASYQSPGFDRTFARIASPGQHFRGSWLVIVDPVVGPDRQLGSLQIVYDLSPTYQRVTFNVLTSLAVATAATVIAFFAATRIKRFLVRPVEELASTARRVSETKDYAIRAQKYSDDELGRLTELFNEMLQRVQMQTEALHNAQSHFRLAVEAAPNAMIMVNQQGTIVLVNREAENLFQYSREQMIGQPVEMLVPERFRGNHPNFRDSFFTGPQARPMGAGRDLFGRRRDGSELPLEIGLNPIRTNEGLMVLSSIVDITERKGAEREREELLSAERVARSEAERASRMKDEFVATLSHELRTPLSAILGWAQMLRSGQSEPHELERGLEIIERNSRVQTQIIEDLLDMSRIISGKIRLDVQQVNLSEVIEAALTTVRPAAEAKGIRLQAMLDPRVGPVRGDASRLQQIVWNLLSNAIKFTGRGGRVQAALELVNSHVEIIVSDTGEGIRPEFLPFVFERFRQADASTTRRHSGLGLGLAIVKQLVELHGGTVRAHSPGANQGATFIVALPLMVVHGRAEPERAHPRVAATAAPSLPQPSLRGLRVLVVDDEPDARELVARLLEHRGATVRCAATASEAIAAFQSFRPNVLISDIGMPVEDGYQLIRKIRALEASGAHTPALALTAFARSEDRTRAMLAGFQMHVAKPVEPAELVATVASLAGLTRESPSN